MNILRPGLFFWGSPHAASSSMQIVIGGTFLGCLFSPKEISPQNLKNKELILMVLLYLAAVLSIFMGDYTVPKQFYYANEIIKVTLLCAFLLLTVTSPEKVFTYEKWLMYCVVFLAIWGVDQHFRGNARLEKLGGFDSNGIAAFFSLFLPIFFSRFIHSIDKKERSLSLLTSGLVAVVILFTKSRGGLLGLIVGIVLTIFRSKKKIKYVLFIVMVFCLSLPLITKQYEDRFQATDDYGYEDHMDGSAESRLYLWKAGLLIFSDNLLFGTGYLTYPLAKFEYESQFSYLPKKLHEAVFRKNNPLVAHNTYITYLSDTGLAGFLPYIFLIVGVFYSNRKIRKSVNLIHDDQCDKLLLLLLGIENGLIALFVCNFFINDNQGMMQFIQITVCAIIRIHIGKKMTELEKTNDLLHTNIHE